MATQLTVRSKSTVQSLSRCFILLCLALLLSTSHSQETSAFTSESLDDVPVLVDDYLDRLSDSELRQICSDRGFDIERDGSLNVTRQDLLEGARRCLSLEDEMNAILAEHPELAAELDKEIERMKKQKELLEKEREEILVQKALLERQLHDAGVDIGPTQTPSSQASVVAKTPQHPVVPDTLEGVLKESFQQLYERVMQDVRLVQKVLSPVTQQLERLWQFVWRYAEPLLGEVYTKARQQVDEFQRKRWEEQQRQQQQAVPATSNEQ